MMNRLRYYLLTMLCCLPLTALAEHFGGVGGGGFRATIHLISALSYHSQEG